MCFVYLFEMSPVRIAKSDLIMSDYPDSVYNWLELTRQGNYTCHVYFNYLEQNKLKCIKHFQKIPAVYFKNTVTIDVEIMSSFQSYQDFSDLRDLQHSWI